MPKNKTKMCPMCGFVDYCYENDCAWWVIDKCAIPQIAVQLALAAMELNERGNKE